MQGAAKNVLPEFLCDRNLRGSLRCSTDSHWPCRPFNLENLDRRRQGGWIAIDVSSGKMTARLRNPCNKKQRALDVRKREVLRLLRHLPQVQRPNGYCMEQKDPRTYKRSPYKSQVPHIPRPSVTTSQQSILHAPVTLQPGSWEESCIWISFPAG